MKRCQNYFPITALFEELCSELSDLGLTTDANGLSKKYVIISRLIHTHL